MAKQHGEGYFAGESTVYSTMELMSIISKTKVEIAATDEAIEVTRDMLDEVAPENEDEKVRLQAQLEHLITTREQTRDEYHTLMDVYDDLYQKNNNGELPN